MHKRFVQITLHKRIGTDVAASLGCTVEPSATGWRLVAPVKDQAQVTGLLIQLDSLNLPYHHVTVTNTETSTT